VHRQAVGVVDLRAEVVAGQFWFSPHQYMLVSGAMPRRSIALRGTSVAWTSMRCSSPGVMAK
jgi:hypothetical protein